MSITHEEIREQLDLLFVGDEAPGILEVRAHLKGCPECRAYFNELAEADSWLRSDEDTTPTLEVHDTFESRYSLAVMRSVDFQAARLAPRPAAPSTSLSFKDVGRWLRATLAPALATGAALALLVWFAPWSHTPEPVDTLTPRGAATPDAIKPRIQSIELFCVEHVEGSVRFHEAQEGTLSCGEGEELKFGLINTASHGDRPWTHLTLVGKPERGSLRWYMPTTPTATGTASMTISEAQRLRPHGETLRLGVNHTAGEELEVIAIFSDTPLPKRGLEKRLLDGQELDGLVVDGEVLGSAQRRYAVTTRRLVIQRQDHRTGTP